MSKLFCHHWERAAKAADGVLLPCRRGELGEGEVGAGHLQGLGGTTPGVGDGRHVVQLHVLVEGGPLADGQHRFTGGGQVLSGGDRGRLDERLQGAAQVEVRAAEGADTGEGGG